VPNQHDCPFCCLEKTRISLESTFAVACLDAFPVTEGHTLVVPRKHAASIGDVDEVTAVAMWSLARRVAAALRTSGLRCEAINLFLADGAAAGQEVFHSHLHVIPRWQGDGFRIEFPPHYGAAAPRKELDDIAGRLRKRL